MRKLQEAGICLHLAGSGRLIIRAKQYIEPGTIIHNKKGRKIARIVEIFGPVNIPYISAVPLTDLTKKSLGHKVYTLARG